MARTVYPESHSPKNGTYTDSEIYIQGRVTQEELEKIVLSMIGKSK
ncbi:MULTISPECIES: hypothetical protein [Paenibacillus]|uniref:DUF4367 domain-containing protein n=1 Tax=Paenibacillus residui TaxID=629724 RepID=A0ABW3D383_9BACL